MPTHTLFRSIELFFHHPSKSSLDNMKAICNQNRIMKILLDFQYHLNKTDSVYMKYLRLFDFRSEHANILVKKFEGTVAKLVIAHGACRAFLANDMSESVKHMKETALSLITSIRNQRKEAPNMLTPEIIIHHLSDLSVSDCFDKQIAGLVESYDTYLLCPEKVTVSSSLFYFRNIPKITYYLKIRFQSD